MIVYYRIPQLSIATCYHPIHQAHHTLSVHGKSHIIHGNIYNIIIHGGAAAAAAAQTEGIE